MSFSTPDFELWRNPLQIKLTSERPLGCKQRQEWAAHGEVEIFETWGKGSSHGSFACGAAEIKRITLTRENFTEQSEITSEE